MSQGQAEKSNQKMVRPRRCEWCGEGSLIDHYRCREMVSGDERFCILHSNDPKKDIELFRSKVKQKQEVGNFDFRGTYFPEDIVFEPSEDAHRSFEGPRLEMKNTDFSEATFCGEVTFKSVEFQGIASFADSRFKSAANFVFAFFRDEAHFRRVSFGAKLALRRVLFAQSVDFQETSYWGPAEFDRVRFKSCAWFSHATFKSEVSFRGTSFGTFDDQLGRPAFFASATFEDKTDFSHAHFARGADFQFAKFLGDVEFGETYFAGWAPLPYRPGEAPAGPPWPPCCAARFHSVQFRGDVVFDRDVLGGSADFSRAEIVSSAIFRGPFREPPPRNRGGPPRSEPGVPAGETTGQRGGMPGGAPMGASPAPPYRGPVGPIAPEIRFEDVRLRDPTQVIFEAVDLGKTTFAGTDLREVHFRHVKWPKKLWHWWVVESSALEPSLAPRWQKLAMKMWLWFLIFNGHNTTADEFAQASYADGLEKARRVCRDLKAALEDQRDHADAGDFYYAEMELRRRQLGGVRGSLLWIYWLVCGYGEKPLRALVVFAFIWVLLAGAFSNTEFRFDRSASWRNEPCFTVGCLPSHKEALGHSIRALTLQQRGGYLEPYSPEAHHLVLAANLVGPVQLGLFGLAMRRRFRR